MEQFVNLETVTKSNEKVIYQSLEQCEKFKEFRCEFR